MDTARGVITLCYGPPRYRDQALALARSIRLRSSGVSLAVVTDRPAAEFAGLFDAIIPFDFAAYPGTTAKLKLAELSPFETTLFIDSDCLCVRRIELLFDYFGAADFAVFGENRPDFAWSEGAQQVPQIVAAPSYPTFNGGLYFFRRAAMARQVFARARHYSADYPSLKLDRPRGAHNDELLIALAMAELGLPACDDTALIPMVAPELPARDLELNLLAGICRFTRCGQVVEPAIVHFVGTRDLLPAYRREQWVLKWIVGAGWPRWTRPLLGVAAQAEHFARRVIGRLRGLP